MGSWITAKTLSQKWCNCNLKVVILILVQRVERLCECLCMNKA